jgi:hypothetical protein
MTPYYSHGGKPKSAEHRRLIGEGQRRAWATKRTQKPLGSTWIDADGYVRVKVAKGSGRWMPEHILVAEEMLGRKLIRGEIVHHVNGDRQDNRPENLYVCRNRSHHNDVHRSQDVALRALLASGRVIFKDGAYEAVL